MIRATGKKDGEKLTVEYRDGKFLFDGDKDQFYEQELRFILRDERVIAGTYVPEKWDDPINIIEVLRYEFFDEKTEVEADEDIALPFEKGVIY